MTTEYLQLVSDGYISASQLPPGTNIYSDDIVVKLSDGTTYDTQIPVYTSADGTSPTGGIQYYYVFSAGTATLTPQTTTILTVQAPGGRSTTYPNWIPLNLPGNTTIVTSPPPGQPDLDFTSFHLNASSTTTQGSISFSYVIADAGTGSAAASDVGLYISTSSTFSKNSATLLDGNIQTGALTAGGSTTATSLYNLNGSVGPGNYFVYLVADNGNVISESNENNNVSLAAALSITAGTIHKPEQIIAGKITDLNFAAALQLGSTTGSITWIETDGTTTTGDVSIPNGLTSQPFTPTGPDTQITILPGPADIGKNFSVVATVISAGVSTIYSLDYTIIANPLGTPLTILNKPEAFVQKLEFQQLSPHSELEDNRTGTIPFTDTSTSAPVSASIVGQPQISLKNSVVPLSDAQMAALRNAFVFTPATSSNGVVNWTYNAKSLTTDALDPRDMASVTVEVRLTDENGNIADTTVTVQVEGAQPDKPKDSLTGDGSSQVLEDYKPSPPLQPRSAGIAAPAVASIPDLGYFTVNSVGAPTWHDIGTYSSAYTVVGTGDFLGSGTDDVLFRNASTGDTGFYAIVSGVNTGWKDIGASSTAYGVAGIGDFNGDGTDDVLYRNTSTGDTGFYQIVNGANTGWHDVGASSPAYDVVGVGNFMGTGTDDILYHSHLTGDVGFYNIANGVNTGWVDVGASSIAYDVVGIGDFTGHGNADILFRTNATGDFGFYEIVNGANTGWHDLGPSATSYIVVGTGNYLGGGNDDVMFHNFVTGDSGFFSIANGINTGWHGLGASSNVYNVS